MPHDALADLKPLIAPAPVAWWPPAPGWWIVGATLLCFFIAALVWGFKRWQRHQRTRYQREALQLLSGIATEIQANPSADTHKSLHDAALILRRAAICAWGRERAGTLPWREIIAIENQSSKNKTATVVDEQCMQLLTNNLYRQQAPSQEALQHLLTQMSAWLKTLPPVSN